MLVVPVVRHWCFGAFDYIPRSAADYCRAASVTAGTRRRIPSVHDSGACAAKRRQDDAVTALNRLPYLTSVALQDVAGASGRGRIMPCITGPLIRPV